MGGKPQDLEDRAAKEEKVKRRQLMKTMVRGARMVKEISVAVVVCWVLPRATVITLKTIRVIPKRCCLKSFSL